jgi:hypothetical protein
MKNTRKPPMQEQQRVEDPYDLFGDRGRSLGLLGEAHRGQERGGRHGCQRKKILLVMRE